MRFTVGAAGAHFDIVIRDLRLLTLLSDVVQSLPEADWAAACKSLALITDDPEKRTRRAWSATTLAGNGRFQIWLSAELATRGVNFIKGAIAHELAHALTWLETQDDYVSEALADAKAAEWGFKSDGFGHVVGEGECQWIE